MRIQTVEIQNWKGITARHALEPITIITGDNCSGKTAISAAVKVGLSGKLPVLGVKGLWKMAGNPEKAGTMSVRLVTDPPGVLSHTWTRNEKGTVSYVPSLPIEFAWPDAMLDFRQFLSLPGAQQAREIFSRCKTSAKAEDYVVDMLATVTSASPVVTSEVVAAVRSWWNSAPPGTLAARIDACTAWLKAQISQANAAEKASVPAFVSHRDQQPERSEDKSVELEVAQAELNQALESVAKHANAWRRYERENAEHQAALARQRAAAEFIERSFSREQQRIKAEKDRVSKLKACPTCGNKGEGWRAQLLFALDSDLKKAEETQAIELATLEQTKPGKAPVKPAETPKASQERIAALQAKVSELQLAQQSVAARAAWQKRFDELSAEVGANTARLMAYKQCLSLLQGWCARLIDQGIEGVLDIANKLARGLIASELDWNGNLGEFGRRDEDGGWISLDTFSGFEEQVAFSALSVAVASSAKVKVVIMDELGRMTRGNKVKVIGRMYELVAQGVIDQFIGLDVDPSDYRCLADTPAAKIITL